MSSAISNETVIIVSDSVKSKSNYRRFGKTDWSVFRDYEDGLAWLATAARPKCWDIGDGKVPVAKRPVVIASLYARTLLDAGNISKSILDAVQGVLYVNDANVAAVSEMTTRAKKHQFVVVGFRQFEPGTDADTLAEAMAELTAEVLAKSKTVAEDVEAGKQV